VSLNRKFAVYFCQTRSWKHAGDLGRIEQYHRFTRFFERLFKTKWRLHVCLYRSESSHRCLSESKVKCGWLDVVNDVRKFRAKQSTRHFPFSSKSQNPPPSPLSCLSCGLLSRNSMSHLSGTVTVRVHNDIDCIVSLRIVIRYFLLRK
jgi:hypothetical protein